MSFFLQSLIHLMRAPSRPCSLDAFTLVIALTLLGGLFLAPAVAKTKAPSSKLYVAELEGRAEIDTGDRIEALKLGEVYNASDSIIYTKVASSNAIVFSNGTGVHLDSDTTLRVEQFVQEPFLPNRTDLDVEPSVSRMILVLTTGRAGFCTSRLVAGSSMEVKTPHALINIRGRRLVVETNERETVVSLIDGDVTVRGGLTDSGGRTLSAWQRAIIRPVMGRNDFDVTIEEVAEAEREAIEDKAALACMARQRVYFDVGDPESEAMRGGRVGTSVFDATDEPEIIRPVPIVPTIPDVPTFVSPAEITQPGSGTE